MGQIHDEVEAQWAADHKRARAEREPRSRLEIEYEEIRLDLMVGQAIQSRRTVGGERIEDWSYFYDVATKTVVLKKFVRKAVAP